MEYCPNYTIASDRLGQQKQTKWPKTTPNHKILIILIVIKANTVTTIEQLMYLNSYTI